MDHIKIKLWGVEDSLVGKMLALQHMDLNMNPRTHMKILSTVVHACNPSPGITKTGDSLRHSG